MYDRSWVFDCPDGGAADKLSVFCTASSDRPTGSRSTPFHRPAGEESRPTSTLEAALSPSHSTRDTFSCRPPDYQNYSERARTLSQLEAFRGATLNRLSNSAEPLRVNAVLSTAGLLSMLGIQPLVGRWFEPAEAMPGGPAGVVLGEHLWQTLFDRDPHVIGSTVEINDRPAAVLGVVPDAAQFGLSQILGRASSLIDQRDCSASLLRRVESTG